MSRTTFNPAKIVVLVLLLPLGACATKRDLQYIQAEVRALSARQDSAFQALTRSVEQANREALDSLRVLSDFFFDFRGDSNNRLLAIQDQQLRLGELVGQSQRSLAGLREDMNTQQQRIEEQLAARPVPADTLEGGAEEEQEPAVPGVTDTAEEAFNAVVVHLNRGSFTVARIGFARFIEEYPNHELAPSAHIHLGEMASQEGRLEDAIASYLKVPELFPTAEEVPNALYRAGVLCVELEDFDQARQYLERVVNSYPDHRFAEPARERLQDIP